LHQVGKELKINWNGTLSLLDIFNKVLNDVIDQRENSEMFGCLGTEVLLRARPTIDMLSLSLTVVAESGCGLAINDTTTAGTKVAFAG